MDLAEVVHRSPGIPWPNVKSNETKSNLIHFILSTFPTCMFLVIISTIPGYLSCSEVLVFAQQLSCWDMHKLLPSFPKPLLNLYEVIHLWYSRKATFRYQKAPRLSLLVCSCTAGDIAARITVSLRQLRSFFFSDFILHCHTCGNSFCTRSKIIHLGLFKMLTLLLFF